MTSIYALVDPRTRAVRYVGRTERVATRYRNHLSVGGGYHPAGQEKHAWVAELRALGLLPEMVVLEECADSDGDVREAAWIARHGSSALLNRMAFTRLPRRARPRSRMDRHFSVYASPEERALIGRAAASEGDATAAWIRKVALRAARELLAAAEPVPKKKGGR